MGYDLTQTKQGNLQASMTLCFHKIYIPPVPRPVGVIERDPLHIVIHNHPSTQI
ncbi:unnamed protein product [marine sediment metagenome]|uniref:Uncharacterized protein n=1 Tax=marine sediment metagenome TaxID=412755 RepID=X1U078_9ZZZZ